MTDKIFSIENFKHFYHVLAVYFVAVGIDKTSIEWGFKITSIGVVIGYGLWKWRTEIIDRRKRLKREEKNESI